MNLRPAEIAQELPRIELPAQFVRPDFNLRTVVENIATKPMKPAKVLCSHARAQQLTCCCVVGQYICTGDCEFEEWHHFALNFPLCVVFGFALSR